MTLYPEPGADPVKEEIKCKRTWLIDGRYLQEELTGQLMGAPYSRTGILTFHRLTRHFEMVTMDNLDTGFMNYESLDVPKKQPIKKIKLFGYFIFAGAKQEVVAWGWQ